MEKMAGLGSLASLLAGALRDLPANPSHRIGHEQKDLADLTFGNDDGIGRLGNLDCLAN